MKISRTIFTLFAAALCFGCSQIPQKKIAFAYGKSIHYWGDHENKIMCEILADAANAALKGRAQADAVSLEDGADFGSLEKYDAIFVIAEGEKFHPFAGKSDLLKRLHSLKKNFAFIHYATNPATGEPEEKTVQELIGGVYKTHFSVNPTYEARFEFAPHPISNGVKPFTITDEIYFNISFAPNASIAHIAKVVPPDKVRKFKFGPHSGNQIVRDNLGRAETVVWAVENPDGTRGFGCTAGHAAWLLQNPDFFKMLLNSSAWLAGVEIPPQGCEAKTPSFGQIAKKIEKEKRPDIDNYTKKWREQTRAWESLN
ncbi:MAG: ThuA domain-containing protein [Opitutales bacterium]|nr:ThuA domain-containing protein [Opitutales bacterium]